jgi:hypothetical protein
MVKRRAIAWKDDPICARSDMQLGIRRAWSEGAAELQGGQDEARPSSSVRKGAVIKTTPKRGTYAKGRKVALTVSSGPTKKH